MVDLQKLYNAVLDGDPKASLAITQQALGENIPPVDLISKYMLPAMDEVGRRFESEEYFVPELLLAARAMKASLNLLRPLLAGGGSGAAGRVVVGTVKGDLHDIGKNLVASLLEGGGFEVIDLGTDVPAEKFLETVRSTGAQIVCLSALLTVTMPAMRNTVQAFRDAGMRERVRIFVGGAPITRQFAHEIGADGYGESAPAAVALARATAGARS